MLNSSNYTLSESTLQSGVQLAPDLDLSDPEVKVYYHQVKGARTHLPDGMEINFLGGMYATKHPDVKEFLDKIADKRGSMVFTKSNEMIQKEIQLAQSDAKIPVADAKKIGVGDKGILSPMVNPLDDSKKV